MKKRVSGHTVSKNNQLSWKDNKLYKVNIWEKWRTHPYKTKILGNDMRPRHLILSDLIDGKSSPVGIAKELSNYDWDSDDELVILTFDKVANMLERYLRNEFDEDYVELWANTIEGRDDIGFRSNESENITEIIFELANPEITQQLTPDSAREIVKRSSGLS